MLSIDWLEITEFATGNEYGATRHIMQYMHEVNAKRERGRFGYAERIESHNGGLITYMPKPEDAQRMGVHHVMTGKFLQQIGSDVYGLILLFGRSPYTVNFTRIDFAIDVYDNVTSEQVMARCIQAQQSGLVRKRKWNRTDGSDGGFTFYSGARTSDVMMRCYDKGIQTETAERGRWTRFEFEVKGTTARVIGNILDALDADKRVWEIAAEYAYFFALDHCGATLCKDTGFTSWGIQPRSPRGTVVPRDADYWLENVVVSAIAKRIAAGEIDGENAGFMQSWSNALCARIGKDATMSLATCLTRAASGKNR